ncbi:MAG: hypothetical protein DRO15_01765 [Thermoprotei archaeon]|nr:MAG: hypothetical protein DRO15_01765 [Thermoprotei archaeon]
MLRFIIRRLYSVIIYRYENTVLHRTSVITKVTLSIVMILSALIITMPLETSFIIAMIIILTFLGNRLKILIDILIVLALPMIVV